jgi:hypothetical protein
MVHSGLAGRFSLTTLTLAGLLACSSKDESGPSLGNGPAAGGAAGQASANGGKSTSGGSATSGAGGAPASGIGGMQVIGISGSLGSSGSGPTCAGETTKAELVPLDIYLMLDSSGSMLNETTLISNKWTEVGEALVTFLRAPESAGIGVGLQYFPLRLASVPDVCTADPACGEGGPCQSKVCLNVALEINALYPCASDLECDFDTQWPAECVTLGDCSIDPTSYCFTEYPETCEGGSCTLTGFCTRTASCDVPTYATPEVAIAELPAAEPALVASLQAKVPEGKTPTAPALQGAIQHVKSWKASHPDHTTIALLATDGLPTECFADPSSSAEEGVAEVVAIAADGRADGVQTFVIGVFTRDEDLELGARQNLNRVAMAGGTDQAFIVDAGQDVAAQFLEALNVIRGARLSCEFKIPESDGTREVDLNKVNVDFTMGTTTTRVPRVTSLSACDPVRGGWYYDVDPSAGEPSRIIICPTSCQAFQAAQNASVQIELGCASEVIE